MKTYKIQFLLLSILFYSAGSSQSLKQLADETRNSPVFSNATWGIYAEYTDTGEEIINLEGHKSLAPASNLKLFTTSAALHYLGEDFRFNTGLYLRGEVDDEGKLHGDIIIKGGGDPTLGFPSVKGAMPLDSVMQEWTSAVKAAGISSVSGSIIADDFLFDRNPLPDYYPWIDMGNYYGAGTSALTIHNNLYYLYLKPGKNVDDPAEVLRTDPEIKGLNFTNLMRTGKEGSGDNGYIYAAPRQFNAVLRGRIPAGVNEFAIKGSIPDPPLFAAEYFRDELLTDGIKIKGTATVASHQPDYTKLKLIHTTVSPPLKDIVYIINKKSDNLYTEQVLKMIGVKKYGEGSVDKGTDAVIEYLKLMGVSVEGLRLFDGSGLSRNNMITPRAMGHLLTALTRQTYFDAFYNSLGIAGDTSDISSFGRFGANTIIAYNTRIKSGTVNGVRAHSGYIKARSGRLVSFSFIANNFTVSVSRVNEAHIQFLKALAEQY